MHFQFGSDFIDIKMPPKRKPAKTKESLLPRKVMKTTRKTVRKSASESSMNSEDERVIETGRKVVQGLKILSKGGWAEMQLIVNWSLKQLEFPEEKVKKVNYELYRLGFCLLASQR